MKSVTEFFIHKLVKGMDAKKAFEAEGKSEEELGQAMGEAFKMEGDKLKYFMSALKVLAEAETTEGLARIQVVSLSEGESVPKGAVEVEENYYISEFNKKAAAPKLGKADKAGPNKKGKGKKDGPRGPKPSPWGESPADIKAKKDARAAADRAKSQGAS